MKETKAEDADTDTGYFMCGFVGNPQPSSSLSSTADKSIQEIASKQHIFVGKEPQKSSITLTLKSQ